VQEEEAGRGKLFAELEPHLNPDSDVEADYAKATATLGMNAESLRQAVSRLRKKFRDCLRERIAATLQDPDDARIDTELHALKAALRA
jgi:RNA polymerase sigma-70 factor (ECF subfamily)